MRFHKRTAILACTMLALSAGPASVHPHIFAEARLEVKVGADRTVESLRHVWRFDEVWSSGEVLLTFDANSDLALDEAELADAGKTFHDSLSEYGFFQFMTLDGKDVKLVAPDQLMVTFENNQITVLYESKPVEPVKISGKADFGVYDPTFYIAIDFADDANLVVEGLPADCTREIIRPDEDQVIAQNQASLTEEFFSDPAAQDVGKLFATRLELSCNA